YHQVILSDYIPARTQAIAVKSRSDHSAVGESDRRRPVPRLHQRTVVFVKRALFAIHVRIARPCFGNQHGHYMRETAPGLKQQFNGVVETGRIAPSWFNDRKQLLDIVPEQWRVENGLASVHPGNVPL